MNSTQIIVWYDSLPLRYVDSCFILDSNLTQQMSISKRKREKERDSTRDMNQIVIIMEMFGRRTRTTTTTIAGELLFINKSCLEFNFYFLSHFPFCAVLAMTAQQQTHCAHKNFFSIFVFFFFFKRSILYYSIVE